MKAGLDGMKAGLDGMKAGLGDLPYFTSTGMLAEWAENSGA